MPESPDLYAEVANLRDEIEEQGSVTDALLRASAAELKQEVLEAFDKDPSLGKILQLVDGRRSPNEILEQLREQGEKGANKATISRKFDRLANDLHLIILDRRASTGNVYRRTRVDKVLGISRLLEKSAKRSR